MAITLAQAAVKSGTLVGTTQVAATFGSNTTTGNTIVVLAMGYNSAARPTVSTVVVSAGTGAFTKIIAAPEDASFTYACCEGWVAPVTTGGTLPKVTVTFSGTVSFVDIVIFEFAGASTTTDGTASVNTGTNATTFTSPAITTTNAGSVIFIASEPSGSWVSGVAPFAANFVQTVTTTAGVSYAIQTATQSGLTGQFTASGNSAWSGLIFALQPPGGGSINLSGLTGAIGATGVFGDQPHLLQGPKPETWNSLYSNWDDPYCAWDAWTIQGTWNSNSTFWDDLTAPWDAGLPSAWNSDASYWDDPNTPWDGSGVSIWDSNSTYWDDPLVPWDSGVLQIDGFTGNLTVAGTPVVGIDSTSSIITTSISVLGTPSIGIDALSSRPGGSILVTGTTNLPAAIPQLTGNIFLTGTTNLPAAIPQLTGSILVTGTALAFALGPQMTGSILVTGSTNLPAAIPQLIGNINVTGTLIPGLAPVGLTGNVLATGLLIPGLAVPLTGNIFVTGTTSLGGLLLTGNWGVTGILNPSLATFLSGSTLVTGLYVPAIAAPLSGSIITTGLYKPGIGLQMAGAILVTGIVNPSFPGGPFSFSGTGFVAVSGVLIPAYQSGTQPVVVPASGMYIALTVEGSYLAVYLYAGVDYSNSFSSIVSGPYADIFPLLRAYDVAITALHAQLEL